MPPETPQNAGYMIAAYIVTALILTGYALSLWRRARRLIDHPPAGTPGTR